MSRADGFDWLQAWGGALTVGFVVFIVFFLQGALERVIPVLALGVVLLLLIVGAVWWAYRRGSRGLAIGMAAGYGVLSLISAGQCTLLSQEPGDQALVGLLAYPALLLAGLLAGGTYKLIERIRRGKEMDQ